MQDASSAAVKRQKVRKRREKTQPIETIGGDLRVWRNYGTNEIVIEPPVFTREKRRISLSARHARHLASSLLLFAAETESSLAFTTARSPIRVAQEADQSP